MAVVGVNVVVVSVSEDVPERPVRTLKDDEESTAAFTLVGQIVLEGPVDARNAWVVHPEHESKLSPRLLLRDAPIQQSALPDNLPVVGVPAELDDPLRSLGEASRWL